LANGPAVPSTQMTCHNLSLLGHAHDVDVSLLAPVADHFEKVGRTTGWPVHLNNEYDALAIQHQIPGGMVGTLRQNLAQHNMIDRLDEVLWETATVRRELGYPGMATPFSQIVGIQAVLNVVTGERYKIVSDEVIWYAAGFYGDMVAPIDPDVQDKILSSDRAKLVASKPPEQPSIEELRKRHGTNDDDEVLLRALVPESDLARMRAAGPLATVFPLLSSPEMGQVADLLTTVNAPALQLQLGQLNVEMYKRGY